MDSAITASARALAFGDALGALRGIALRDDPPALALRGIAMAQLGEHARARELLRRAARRFGAHEDVARARCRVAEAEVALATRDVDGSPRALAAAQATLAAHGDRANALQAELIGLRRSLLLGRLDDAAARLATLASGDAPATQRAVAALCAAELALRTLRIDAAREALSAARAAALQAGVPALLAEVEQARAAFAQPAARRIDGAGEQPLDLAGVAAVLASGALVVDACRRGVALDGAWRPLARRPLLFTLLRTLALAAGGDVDRGTLIHAAFRIRRPDETHRARLRVEIGRLRALLHGCAQLDATERGFALRPHGGREVVVLAPPIEGEQASLLALLADGAAWSTSALALALDASQRTVQRALAELEEAGRVRAIGQARARRWLAPPLTGYTTVLLLPGTRVAG